MCGGGGAVTCPGAHLGISELRGPGSPTQGVAPVPSLSHLLPRSGTTPYRSGILVLMPVPLEGRTGLCVISSAFMFPWGTQA